MSPPGVPAAGGWPGYPETYTVRGVHVPGEVEAGTDLAALAVAHADLRDGDVLVVSSKVVSKAEGRRTRLSRDDAVRSETDRLVARRGPTSVVRTRLGLVMAAAGVDASNTEPGTVLLLPVDPDASARALRSGLAGHGLTVGVVVSDTCGRAWRTGQTDIALGVAGLLPLVDHHGRTDPHGNPLLVTSPALADELAGAAEPVMGKLGRRPFAVLRGLAAYLTADDGPGARALTRPEQQDMFGLGSREAVLQAVRGAGPHPGFGAPASRAALVEALGEAGLAPEGVAPASSQSPDDCRLAQPDGDPEARGHWKARLEALATAHGWRATYPAGLAVLAPVDP